jgi:hypothetical protein
MSAGETARDVHGAREARERASGVPGRARQVAHPGRRTPVPLLLALLFPAPALASSAIEFEGGPVVLGRSEQVRATLRVEGDDKLPLRLAASAGTFGEAERVKPGVWRVTYKPPATRFPQTAIAALWRENGNLQVEFLRFPLLGVMKLPVKATAGFQVTAEVEGKSFGPVVAGEDGQAVLPVVVPPGAREATVRAKGQIASTLKKVELHAPDGNRLLAVALRPAGAQSRTPARLLLLYDGPRDFSTARIQIAASSGTVALEKSSGTMHAYRWTPPASIAERKVTFAVTVDGDPASRCTAELLLPPPPGPKVAPVKPDAPAGPQTKPAESGQPAVPEKPTAAAKAAAGASTQTATAGPAAPSILLVGTRAGFADSLQDLLGPRAGVEAWLSVPPAWVPLGLPLGLGLCLQAGSARRAATAPAGEAQATYLPLALRLAWEPRAGGRFVGRLGAGAMAAWVKVRTPARSGGGFAAGPLAFASAAVALGRAELFAEISYGNVPATTSVGRFDAGGLGMEAGLRVGVF